MADLDRRGRLPAVDLLVRDGALHSFSFAAVGVLGGGAGTTRDTLELVAQAERYGGRLALFGRKINLAEAPLELIALMRQVADGTIQSDEAVRAYHGHLQKLKLRPARPLAQDIEITEEVLKPAASKLAA